MMRVMIGAVTALTEKCVVGLEANRAKAEGWRAFGEYAWIMIA